MKQFTSDLTENPYINENYKEKLHKLLNEIEPQNSQSPGFHSRQPASAPLEEQRDSVNKQDTQID